MRLIDCIKAGDRVTIADYDGKQRTGRAVMPSTADGWVLNMGGAHGTPAIAMDCNTIKVRRPKSKKVMAYSPFEDSQKHHENFA